jgi:PD-(D/E)XK nuclease superfamily
MSFEQAEVPRHPKWGGPYVIPPGRVHRPGEKRCGTCGRMVKPEGQKYKKGSCKCMYYKRTTKFIDVIQDEFLLKQWGKRNVAYGMGQRPDLVLAAASCRPDSDDLQSDEDKAHLNDIAAQAQVVAGDKIAATVGTSLHRLTHQMDRGEELGFVPEPYPDDLKAYDNFVKTEEIEWVSVEAFRSYDGWVPEDCDHAWGQCTCIGVAGTVDRIGWYKGRLRVFDIKTGSMFNKSGHAMQLAMYAHMVPYQFPEPAGKEPRGKDIDDVDLSVAYIIELPAGEGQCRLIPMDIEKGWRAVEVAKTVWDIRNDKQWHVEDDHVAIFTEMAMRAGSLRECKLLWRNAKEKNCLDRRLRYVLSARAEELKRKGITA